MLKVNACDRQTHDSTEMELKLRQVGGVAKGNHACVVRTW